MRPFAAYTAVVAEEIARKLDAQVIKRSSSFGGFLSAVCNGTGDSQTAQSAD